MKKIPKPSSLTDRTLMGLIWTFSGAGTRALLQVAVLMVLARLLSPTDFGLVGAAMVLIGMFEIFSQLGIAPAIVQRGELREEHVRAGLTLSLILGVVLSALLFFGAPIFKHIFPIDGIGLVVQVLAIVFTIRAAGVVSEALMQRELKFERIAVMEVVSFTFGYGLIGVILAVLGWGPWALVSAYVGQSVLKVGLALVMRPVPSFTCDLRPGAELMRFGFGYTVGRIGAVLADKGDHMIVSITLGAEALGLYGRAKQFLDIPSQICAKVMDKVLFPAIATLQDSTTSRVAHVYRNGTNGTLVGIIPISILGIMLAAEIVEVVLGDQWAMAVIPMQILLGILPFKMAFRVSNSVILAEGAVYSKAWRTWTYAVFLFVGAWLGQHYGGLMGVAVAVCLATASYTLSVVALALRITKAKWEVFGPGVIVSCFISTIALGPTWLVLSQLRIYADLAIARLFIAIAVFVPFYLGAVIIVAPRINRELFEFFAKLFGHLARKLPSACGGRS